MRAPIKLLLWLLAGVGTIAAVLVASLFFVDVSLFRAPIERQVTAAFGRDVILEGPLKLKPSLTPRFAVNGLKIANPEWASRPFLATVDKFDIRVSLLPLLRGDLEIVSLEFHGVDLLLEKTSDGTSNFTFGESSKPAALPAIERMSLNDAAIAYAAPEAPVRHLHLDQVTARKVPGEPVTLEARTAVNAVPVKISLLGEPPDDGRPDNPWQLTLLGEAGELSLRVTGSVADPTDWRHGEFRLDLKGRHLDDLETLSGYTLPDAQPVALGANIRFDLDEYLTVSDLTGEFGTSDIHGNLHWDMSASPPAIKVRLESQEIDAGDIEIGDSTPGNADHGNTDFWEQPLDPGVLGVVDLDIEVQVQRLDGLAKPVHDIALSAHADRQFLRLATARATVDGIQITSSASLPWGERLTTVTPQVISLKTLLQHVEMDIQAQAPDAAHHYATNLMGRPLHLSLSSVEATARQGAAVSIQAEAALNDKPVALTLQGEPLATLLQRPSGPWQALVLEVRGDDIRLDANGRVDRPLEANGFDVRFDASGTDIDALLPLQGAWSLTGHYGDDLERRVLDELKMTVGRSDIGGRIAFYPSEQRSRLVANLDASQIQLDEILPGSNGETTATAGWDEPLDIGGLGALDLDVELHVRRLEGLVKPVRDILLRAHANEKTLTLAPVQGTLDGIRLDARAQLPWGEPLTGLAEDGITVTRLMNHADLTLNAQAPDGTLHYPTTILGHPVDLTVTGFEASAPPDKALRVSARAKFDETPIEANLQAESLAKLLKQPSGPWQDLSLEVRGGDVRLQASGSVEQPLEARGFDIQYALSGDQIDQVLPLFDFVLPLEGPFSLTGHFADLPDRNVFDKLKIQSGGSDIAGRISVYQGEERPRLVAHLNSEQIYLRELLPVNETEVTSETKRYVIPDYSLPIEEIRQIDGELQFKGKRLRTDAGDLGDINFNVTLKDGVFRIDPFRVRGWAGALIDVNAEIDASQDPPLNTWQVTARNLTYGLLLGQAGLAETVEGDIDVTFSLSGKGRTRREFLSDASGKLVIIGQEGKFGSRRLDLWGSPLVTTMLSREWRREDVTDLNCLVARISIKDGIASSDDILVDSRRITIGAVGTLDLESEELNVVVAPRAKRASLVSLTSPVHVTGTLAAPEVAVTVLPRRRLAAAGAGALAGLINPGYLIFAFSQTGSGQANTCAAAIERAMAMKGRSDELDDLPTPAARRFSLLPGCTRSGQRRAQ